MTKYVYLIAVESGNVAVEKHNDGWVLPGCVCTEDLTHEECLIRYCMERFGYDAEVWDFVCEERDGDISGYYYNGAIAEAISEEHRAPDLLPLTQIHLLSSPAQRRAAEECLQMMRSDAHGSDDEDL